MARGVQRLALPAPLKWRVACKVLTQLCTISVTRFAKTGLIVGEHNCSYIVRPFLSAKSSQFWLLFFLVQKYKNMTPAICDPFCENLPIRAEASIEI